MTAKGRAVGWRRRNGAPRSRERGRYEDLLCVVDAQLAGRVLEVGGVALRGDARLVGLLDQVVPALLLAKVDGCVERIKPHRERLLVVGAVCVS